MLHTTKAGLHKLLQKSLKIEFPVINYFGILFQIIVGLTVYISCRGRKSRPPADHDDDGVSRSSARPADLSRRIDQPLQHLGEGVYVPHHRR